LTWTKPADSLEGAGDMKAMNGKLREATAEFIELERQGIREYKMLSQEILSRAVQGSPGFDDPGFGKAH
jgi:hypothetical protein